MSSRQIKDALLEKYLANAIEENLRAQVEATLATSAADAQRLAELRADSEAFLIAHPPSKILAQVSAKKSGWNAWVPKAFAFSLASALAVGLLVVVRPHENTSEADFGIKGGLSWVLYGKLDHETVRLVSGATVRPKTALRFEVFAPKNGYVAVLGKDAWGVVSVYYPFDGKEAAKYDKNAPLLPGAIELDVTLGTEQFFAVYCEKPFEIKPLEKSIQQHGQPTDVPKDCDVAAYELQKRP